MNPCCQTGESTSQERKGQLGSTTMYNSKYVKINFFGVKDPFPLGLLGTIILPWNLWSYSFLFNSCFYSYSIIIQVLFLLKLCSESLWLNYLIFQGYLLVNTFQCESYVIVMTGREKAKNAWEVILCLAYQSENRYRSLSRRP